MRADQPSPDEVSDEQHETEAEAFSVDDLEGDDLTAVADVLIDEWAEATPTEVQEVIVTKFVEDGTLDHEVIGISEAELAAVQRGFEANMVAKALAPVGLDLQTYLDHVDEADLPAIRQLVVKADWSTLMEHAQRIALARREAGL